jgi:hypothetical protein
MKRKIKEEVSAKYADRMLSARTRKERNAVLREMKAEAAARIGEEIHSAKQDQKNGLSLTPRTWRAGVIALIPLLIAYLALGNVNELFRIVVSVIVFIAVSSCYLILAKN